MEERHKHKFRLFFAVLIILFMIPAMIVANILTGGDEFDPATNTQTLNITTLDTGNDGPGILIATNGFGMTDEASAKTDDVPTVHTYAAKDTPISITAINTGAALKVLEDENMPVADATEISKSTSTDNTLASVSHGLKTFANNTAVYGNFIQMLTKTIEQATVNKTRSLNAGASGLDSGLNTAQNSVILISTRSGLMVYESILPAGNDVDIPVTVNVEAIASLIDAMAASFEAQAFTISNETTLPIIVLTATTGREDLDFDSVITHVNIKDTGIAADTFLTAESNQAMFSADEIVFTKVIVLDADMASGETIISSDGTTLQIIVLTATTGREDLDFDSIMTNGLVSIVDDLAIVIYDVKNPGVATGTMTDTNHKAAALTANDLVSAGFLADNLKIDEPTATGRAPTAYTGIFANNIAGDGLVAMNFA